MVDGNPYGLAFVPEAIILLALAVAIFRARSSSPQNQSLAMVLFALASMACGLAIGYLAEDPGVASGGYAVLYAGWFLLMVAQFRFAASLQVPWLRVLRHRWVDRALLGVYLLGPLIVMVWLLPQTYERVVSYRPYVPWRPFYHPGAFETWSYVVSVVSLVVLAAAGHAWQREPRGSRVRTTMGTYFVAAAFIEGITVTSTLLRADIVHRLQEGGFVSDWKVPTFLWSVVLFFLAYIMGLGYAILKAQVFDIDLKIKWALKQSTVAAVFVGVFFVASEGAQQLLSERIGPFAGLLATGALVFALSPLMRAADRLSSAAMPRVVDTAEYRAVRKLDVYRAAVESALQGGDISPKERGMLATLQDQLDIGAKVAHDIERDARAARVGVA